MDTYGAYSDADFASNPNDRKSFSGYVFMLAYGPIAWYSKKQHMTALSTTEAEYSAITQATQQAIWFNNFFSATVLL